jgi:hypothetical protein
LIRYPPRYGRAAPTIRTGGAELWIGVAAQLMPTSEERSPPSRLLVSFAFRFEVEAVGGIRFIPSPFAIDPLQDGLNTSFG